MDFSKPFDLDFLKKKILRCIRRLGNIYNLTDYWEHFVRSNLTFILTLVLIMLVFHVVPHRAREYEFEFLVFFLNGQLSPETRLNETF